MLVKGFWIEVKPPEWLLWTSGNVFFHCQSFLAQKFSSSGRLMNNLVRVFFDRVSNLDCRVLFIQFPCPSILCFQ